MTKHGMATMPFEEVPPLSSVEQYVYPFDSDGRESVSGTATGVYSADDATERQLAPSLRTLRTLWQLNTSSSLTRDVRIRSSGRPVLFYRQLEQKFPVSTR